MLAALRPYRVFIAFYALTFLLLGLIPLLSWIFNDGSMDFSAAAARATAVVGIPWTSNLIAVLRLSAVEPVLLLSLLGSSVPALAAILILTFQARKANWLRFRHRLLPYRNCTAQYAGFTYLAICAILIACLGLVFWLRNSLGADYESSFTLSSSMAISILLLCFLDQGALLEELGWRGYTQSEMQFMGLNPLVAAVIVGIAWGLWHLPRDITTGVIERLGWFSYLIQYLPSFLLGTVAVSIIAIFFSNRLGGSVIPAVVVHGLCNDAVGISGSASIVEALTPFHQITKNLPFALVASLLLLFSGTRLGLRNDKQGC